MVPYNWDLAMAATQSPKPYASLVHAHHGFLSYWAQAHCGGSQGPFPGKTMRVTSSGPGTKTSCGHPLGTDGSSTVATHNRHVGPFFEGLPILFSRGF